VGTYEEASSASPNTGLRDTLNILNFSTFQHFHFSTSRVDWLL
jgi:hypothetical protein